MDVLAYADSIVSREVSMSSNFNFFVFVFRAVDNVILNIDRLFPNMTMVIARPFASNAVLTVKNIFGKNFIFLITNSSLIQGIICYVLTSHTKALKN